MLSRSLKKSRWGISYTYKPVPVLSTAILFLNLKIRLCFHVQCQPKAAIFIYDAQGRRGVYGASIRRPSMRQCQPCPCTNPRGSSVSYCTSSAPHIHPPKSRLCSPDKTLSRSNVGKKVLSLLWPEIIFLPLNPFHTQWYILYHQLIQTQSVSTPNREQHKVQPWHHCRNRPECTIKLGTTCDMCKGQDAGLCLPVMPQNGLGD